MFIWTYRYAHFYGRICTYGVRCRYKHTKESPVFCHLILFYSRCEGICIHLHQLENQSGLIEYLLSLPRFFWKMLGCQIWARALKTVSGVHVEAEAEEFEAVFDDPSDIVLGDSSSNIHGDVCSDLWQAWSPTPSIFWTGNPEASLLEKTRKLTKKARISNAMFVRTWRIFFSLQWSNANLKSREFGLIIIVPKWT